MKDFFSYFKDSFLINSFYIYLEKTISSIYLPLRFRFRFCNICFINIFTILNLLSTVVRSDSTLLNWDEMIFTLIELI